MANTTMPEPEVLRVTVGVDTHKDAHVAAARDHLGRQIGTKVVATTPAGYKELLSWARDLGVVAAFGVEGTGSYGAGLARFLSAEGALVIEVIRPNRQRRRRKLSPTRLTRTLPRLRSSRATPTRPRRPGTPTSR